MNSVEIIEITPENILDIGTFCGRGYQYDCGNSKKAQWYYQRFEEGLRIKVSRSPERDS